jgi:hypothetical protein
MKSPFSTAIAITIGVMILLGYFITTPLIQNVRLFLIEWAIILGGIATLVSILNMIRVHWRKVRSKDFYSVVVILAFLITLVAGILLSPSNKQFQNVVTYIQIPVEATLMGILTFSLMFATIRLFKINKGIMGVIFLVSTLVFLLISSIFLTSTFKIPGIELILSALQTLPLAGARGILLGVALGGIIAGIRVLIGVDRPYRG